MVLAFDPKPFDKKPDTVQRPKHVHKVYICLFKQNKEGAKD